VAGSGMHCRDIYYRYIETVETGTLIGGKFRHGLTNVRIAGYPDCIETWKFGILVESKQGQRIIYKRINRNTAWFCEDRNETHELSLWKMRIDYDWKFMYYQVSRQNQIISDFDGSLKNNVCKHVLYYPTGHKKSVWIYERNDGVIYNSTSYHYHPNGKLKYVNVDENRQLYKAWYANGQLQMYTHSNGKEALNVSIYEYTEYYPDGRLKKHRYTHRGTLVHNYGAI
jgi:hypothetical protein